MVTIGQTLKIHEYCSQVLLFVCLFCLSNGILMVSCLDLMKRTIRYVKWCPVLKLILPKSSLDFSPVTTLGAMWFRIAKKTLKTK